MTQYKTYRRKKRSKAPAVLAVMIIVMIVLGLIGYFGYGMYLDAAYPLKYEEHVERYSKEYNVDKYFVYAVIRTESGFKPDAVSDVGARGLMQIMEDTFEWVKFRMGDEDAVYSDMFNPRTNIQYGCWLLGYLYNEFGSIEVAAAAYHAGRGNVNKWLKDDRYSSDGVHLDKIPIRDTAHYVSKITRARDIYVQLYSEERK